MSPIYAPPPKAPENPRFSGVFRRYKMGILATNGSLVSRHAQVQLLNFQDFVVCCATQATFCFVYKLISIKLLIKIEGNYLIV